MRNRQFRNQDTCWHQFLDVRTPKILLRDSSTFQVALSIPTLVAYYELYVGRSSNLVQQHVVNVGPGGVGDILYGKFYMWSHHVRDR